MVVSPGPAITEASHTMISATLGCTKQMCRTVVVALTSARSSDEKEAISVQAVSDPARPKVFVSHATEDKDRFVFAFAEALRAEGVYAWLDVWEMQPGDSLVDKIFTEGIGEADAVIVVSRSRASIGAGSTRNLTLPLSSESTPTAGSSPSSSTGWRSQISRWRSDTWFTYRSLMPRRR